MQVEKDIEIAREFIKGNTIKSNEYRRVRLFTSVSLKHFKKYKIADKSILTKYNSGDEVIDLLSYHGNLTCYSPNRFDEYFLNLKLAFLQENYDDYFSYFFKTYKEKSKNFLSYDGYVNIRNYLDDKTRYFFDEIFRKNPKYALYSKLLTKTEYDYDALSMNIRYFLKNRYYEAQNNNNIKFILSNDVQIKTLVDELYSFINLSYSLDHMDDEQIKFIKLKIEEDFQNLLLENGKIQVFLGTTEKEISDYKILETKNESSLCKKQYAYMYTNK